MSDSPVAVQAGASLLGRWLLPRVRQHSALSAVSWRSDLRGAANIQQLRRQNFCSRWTSLVELSSAPAAQPRHRTVHLFRQAWTRRFVTSDMRRLRKTVTYLDSFLRQSCDCSEQCRWLERPVDTRSSQNEYRFSYDSTVAFGFHTAVGSRLGFRSTAILLSGYTQNSTTPRHATTQNDYSAPFTSFSRYKPQCLRLVA